ncbi:hypothetical protein [Tessaracoccus sp. ZS01]|uniref:hypothetical protein n=1 Tax=Tessaracoccus sp. ZS01 TaxID=1906324 RepID=UPI00096D11C5|nr:hypothetical protein [Tessaracoccus sp. ZS01]MCG6568772.1 hypothetical protein [Tessaracoccus sp. ZS01]OMG51742.1 hypothetical protein BJN44_14235 [Tessaracoccus sp. ZS01]
MADAEAWRHWATLRNLHFFPAWEAMTGTFRGGGLHVGGQRAITVGWSGTYAGLPCFGFRATAGSDPAGHLHVVALRVPGVRFPWLSIEVADFTQSGPGIPIEADFDLAWRVSAAHPQFANDVLNEAVRQLLIPITADFSEIWFEHDAVLLSARGRVDPEHVDRYLDLLRKMVDAIDSRVLDAIRPRPYQRALPAYLTASAPALRTAAPRPVVRRGTTWQEWAGQRGWLYYANAREIVERFNQGPVPSGRFVHGFVGRFGDLPCFGWQWISAPEQGTKIRQVLCVRRPGLVMNPVRLTAENALLAELMGTSDIEVGDPTFDARWRVTSSDADATRRLLGPAVWRFFTAPTTPEFSQLWLEREVAAVVIEGPAPREHVDGYLRFLHDIIGAVAHTVDGG